MADLYLAIEFSAEQNNLSGFASYLQKIGFPHRLSEYKNGLALWVYQEPHVTMANELYQHYLNDRLVDIKKPSAVSRINMTALSHVSITLLLILLSILGFIAVQWQWIELVEWLSFQGFEFTNGIELHSASMIMQQIKNGEVWRLLTPIFLHFDFMHIAFNMTLLWFFSSQIEKIENKLAIVFYVLITGVFSNIVQYMMVPEHLFGGMSGVNYGLMTYCFLMNYLTKKTIYQFPAGLFWFATFMMLLGFTGVFSLVGYSIANWAHLSGMLAGFILVLFVYGKNRWQAS